jgi:hypothetical protein
MSATSRTFKIRETINTTTSHQEVNSIILDSRLNLMTVIKMAVTAKPIVAGVSHPINIVSEAMIAFP